MGRKLKATTGYRIPPDIERGVNALIESGEFNTKADVFTAALRFYLENRNKNTKNEVMTFLDSPEGIEYISKVIERSKKRRKNEG